MKKIIFLKNITKTTINESLLNILDKYKQKIKEFNKYKQITIEQYIENKQRPLQNYLCDKFIISIIYIKYNKETIFKYLQSNNDDFIIKKYPILFNKYIIFEYKRKQFFIRNIETKINYLFSLSISPILFCYDLLNDIFILSNDLGIYKLKFNKPNIDLELKYKINNELKIDLGFEYNNIFIKCNYIILMTNTNIYLFQEEISTLNTNNKYKTIIIKDKINIYNFNSIYPFLYNEWVYIILDNTFIYKIDIVEKNEEKQKFQDNNLLLNKINYGDIIDKIKFKLYILIHVKKIELKNIKTNNNLIDNEIISYINKIEEIINVDNYKFYLEYMLENNLFDIVLIYDIIYDEFGIINKLYTYMESNEKLYLNIYIKESLANIFNDLIYLLKDSKIYSYINN